MNLSPTELERLTIYLAAEMARRNLREGIRLSRPEAIAYLTDELMLLARADLPLAEVRDRAGRMLTAEQVLPGVAAMVPLLMIELPMDEGTKLLTVYDPIPVPPGDLEPGEVIPSGQGPDLPFESADVVEIEVVNEGDRDIQVRSMTHFFEVNRALRFDRAAAYGRRLAVPAGAGVRFEPGIPKLVPLAPIGGDRIVQGQAGLVEGWLDDPQVRHRAFERARERGYLREEDSEDLT